MGECVNQITVKVCKINGQMCSFAGREQDCPNHKVDCGGENVPTFGQWLNIWWDAAEKRLEDRGSDNRRFLNTRRNDLLQFMEVMGLAAEDKVSAVTRKTMTEFVVRIKDRYAADTVHSKVGNVRGVFDKWLRRMFEDVWNLPVFDMPDMPPRLKIKELPPELLMAVKRWYRSLIGRKMRGQPANKDRLFAMFMFRFAVRNGDVTRLRWSNIENINGRLRLRYTPNKTHLTSEREVKAWMDNEMDVADLRQYRIECGNPPDDAFIFGGGKCQELQDRLCAELRAIGLEGGKALYWLRKICLTELYKRKGREAVYALSGDNTDEILFGHYVPRGSYEVSVEDME